MLSGPPPRSRPSISVPQICRGRPGPEDVLDTLVGDDTRQSVGAEQQPIAGASADLVDVDFGIVAAGQRAGHDVAPRMLPRRVRGHDAGAHLFLDPRVIVGDLLELAVAKQVDAAVADVRDARALRRRRSGRPTPSSPCRAGRAPSIAVAIRRLARRNAALSRLHSAERGIVRKRPGAVASAPAVSPMNASIASTATLRRDLARDVPAHAVGDDEQAQVGARAVAVFVAAPAQTALRPMRTRRP